MAGKSSTTNYFSVDLIEFSRELVGMSDKDAGVFIKKFRDDLIVCDPRKAHSKAAEMTILRTLKYRAVGKMKTEKARKKLAEIRKQKQALESVTDGYVKDKVKVGEPITLKPFHKTNHERTA